MYYILKYIEFYIILVNAIFERLFYFLIFFFFNYDKKNFIYYLILIELIY